MQLERISVENRFEKKGNSRTTTSKHCRQQQPYDVGSGGKEGWEGCGKETQTTLFGGIEDTNNLEEFVLLFGKETFTPK